MTIQAEWTLGGNVEIRQRRYSGIESITIERADLPELVRLLTGALAGGRDEVGIPVEGIWLRYVGGENDPYANVVVDVEIGGTWFEAIREPHGACFSHCISAAGIRKVLRK